MSDTPDAARINAYRSAAGRPPFSQELRIQQLETLRHEGAALVAAIEELDDFSFSSDYVGSPDEAPVSARVGYAFAEATSGRPREVFYFELLEAGTLNAKIIGRLGRFKRPQGGVFGPVPLNNDLVDMAGDLIRSYLATRAMRAAKSR